MVDRKTTTRLIDDYNIPKVAVAKLSNSRSQDITAFTSGMQMSEDRALMIVQAVGELVSFIKSLPYPPDMRDTDKLRETIGSFRLASLHEKGAVAMRAEYEAVSQAAQVSGE